MVSESIACVARCERCAGGVARGSRTSPACATGRRFRRAGSRRRRRSRLSWGPTVVRSERLDAVVSSDVRPARRLARHREAAGARAPCCWTSAQRHRRGHAANSAENLERMTEVGHDDHERDPLGERVPRAFEPAVHALRAPVEVPGDVRYAERLCGTSGSRGLTRERLQDLPLAAAGSAPAGAPGVEASPRVGELSRCSGSWTLGSLQPRFGIANLADIGPEFEQAAGRRRSAGGRDGRRGRLRREIEPLSLPTSFARWDRRSIFDHWPRARSWSAELVDEFSRVGNRSPWRLAGARSVADSDPPLEALADIASLRRLPASCWRTSETVACRRPSGAEPVLEREFGPMVQCWFSVLT